MPQVTYTSRVELIGEAPREFESAILEEALGLAILGVLSGVIWVGQSPYPDGDPFLSNSEDGGRPDQVIAEVQFTATDPAFSTVGREQVPCRCGASWNATIHTTGYVTGLFGHKYDPAS